MLMVRREVNCVTGEGTIRGIVMKAESDTFKADSGRDVKYHAVRCEHAGMAVKIPATEAVFKQVADLVGREVDFSLIIGVAPDRQARGDRGASALRLDYQIVSARPVSSEGSDPSLNLNPPPESPRRRGLGG